MINQKSTIRNRILKIKKKKANNNKKMMANSKNQQRIQTINMIKHINKMKNQWIKNFKAI